MLRATVDELASDGVVLQPHLARGASDGVVSEADVIGPRVHVQADGAFVEGVGDAVDAVFTLLQVQGALGGTGDASVRHQPDSVSGAGSIEADEVFQPQHAPLDGEPAELPRVVVDGALRLRLPAQRHQLEELVPVDEVAGVALGSEVQIGRKRAAVQQDAAQARAYLPGLEVGRRDPPQRLDDSFHRDLHAHPSFPSS